MNLGVYVGRLSPMHLGHEAVIREMLKVYGSDSLLILGSSNAPQSMRHLFSYEDRREFVKTIFPDLSIVGLPDYETNSGWFTALNDILELKNAEITSCRFFAGCHEDIRLLNDEFGFDFQYDIVDRIDGPAAGISATGVRDALLKGQTVDGLINTKLFTLVRKRFDERWKEFSQR